MTPHPLQAVDVDHLSLEMTPHPLVARHSRQHRLLPHADHLRLTSTQLTFMTYDLRLPVDHLSLEMTQHPLQPVDVDSSVIQVHKSVCVVHCVVVVALSWKVSICSPFICSFLFIQAI